MSKKNQFWRELQLETVRGIRGAIETAHCVRVYPSQKYPGITMFKIANSAVEYTGRLPDTQVSELANSLKSFTAAPDKKATVYSRKATVETRLYLEYAIASIEMDGWHPARGNEQATWRRAFDLYQDRQPLTMNAIERYWEIFTEMVQTDGSDYGNRLADILKKAEAHLDDLAMLASAPIALDRRRARQAVAQTSQHIGTIGQVMQIDYLEVVYTRIVDTSYGPRDLYKLRDQNGNQFTAWFEAQCPELPRRFAAQVTVTAHQEYRGVEETVISIAPLSIRELEICPACGGRYDQQACTCILSPADYDFQPGEFDIEIGAVE